jgi:hypothetical protein
MASVTWRAQLEQVMPLMVSSTADATEESSKPFFKIVMQYRLYFKAKWNE